MSAGSGGRASCRLRSFVMRLPSAGPTTRPRLPPPGPPPRKITWAGGRGAAPRPAQTLQCQASVDG